MTVRLDPGAVQAMLGELACPPGEPGSCDSGVAQGFRR